RSVERCLPEGQEAGIAEQQVEAQAEQAPDEHPAEEVGTSADQRRQERRRAQHHGRDELDRIATTDGSGRPGGRPGSPALRRARAGFDSNGIIRLAHALPSTPSRPCGRKISTNAMAANSMTSE